MNKEEFLKALKESDFGIGDSFWLEDIEFEVINKKSNLRIDNDKVQEVLDCLSKLDFVFDNTALNEFTATEGNCRIIVEEIKEDE